jgi:hypothetical protein
VLDKNLRRIELRVGSILMIPWLASLRHVVLPLPEDLQPVSNI